MKFASINIVTLPGHNADVDVLLERSNLDLLGVTESHLALYLTVIYVLMAMHVAEKIETVRVVDVHYLLRTNGLANEELVCYTTVFSVVA